MSKECKGCKNYGKTEKCYFDGECLLQKQKIIESLEKQIENYKTILNDVYFHMSFHTTKECEIERILMDILGIIEDPIKNRGKVTEEGEG